MVGIDRKYMGNSVYSARRPPNVWISLAGNESKMAPSNFRLMNEIFNSQLHMSSCFRSSLDLSDPENMSTAKAHRIFVAVVYSI